MNEEAHKRSREKGERKKIDKRKGAIIVGREVEAEVGGHKERRV